MGDTRNSQEQIVVKPGRNIVASGADDLKKELDDVLNKGAKKLVVDLSGVEMIDSIGIGVLISAFKTVSESDGSMSVIKVSADICGLFKTMRLDRVFDVTPVPA